MPTATFLANPNTTITSVTLVAGTGSTYVLTNSNGTSIPSTGNESVVTAADTYSVIVIDRINGYEIRQFDSNATSLFAVNRLAHLPCE